MAFGSEYHGVWQAGSLLLCFRKRKEAIDVKIASDVDFIDLIRLSGSF